MSKLRKVYKGEEQMEEFAELYKNKTNSKPEEEAKNMFEYINTSTNNY